VLSVDALAADGDVDVDGDLENIGDCPCREFCAGWGGREFVHGCEVVNAMRCGAMRCDTPPDIVEQTTHERTTVVVLIIRSDESRFLSYRIMSCYIISYHVVS
jgi:hypothetical protein